jgi:hypothetical protein
LENADAGGLAARGQQPNLEQFVEMQRWRGVGRRRFPDPFRFVACQLQLMSTLREFERLRGKLAIGGALARAGLPDSARAVIARVHEAITPKLVRKPVASLAVHTTLRCPAAGHSM